MSLRLKTIAIIVLTSAGLLVVLVGASYQIMLRSYADLERQSIRQDVERSLDALSEDAAALNSTARDWAAWDDTYLFIQGRNQAYAESNLIDSTFINLRLSFMVFIDTTGRVVLAKAVDLHSETAIPVPQSLLDFLSDPGAGALVSLSDPTESVAGLVVLPDGPFLVAARPILTSLEEGPIQGTLLVGRHLDEAEVARLAGITHLSLTLEPIGGAGPHPDFGPAPSNLATRRPIQVQIEGRDTIAGYALLDDVTNQPALVLRVDSPRAIYQQGWLSVRYFAAFMGLSAVAFAVVMSILLEREVVARVAALGKSVRRIGAADDLSSRVELPGRDELSGLAEAINGMLDALSRSREALRHAHDELEERVRERTTELTKANQVLAAEIAERMRIEDEIQRRNRELSLLNRVIAASASQEADGILAVACEQMAGALGAVHAAAVLFDDERSRVHLEAEYPAPAAPPVPGAPSGGLTAVADSPACRRLAAGQAPTVVEGATAGWWAPAPKASDPAAGAALLLLPLVAEGEVIGGIGLLAAPSQQFSAGEIDLAWRVAEQAAGGVTRVRLLGTLRRLGTVVEQVDEAVIITNPAGHIIYVNPAFERATGYSRAEAAGQTPRLLKSGKQDAALYRELWRTITGGQVWRGRLVNRKKDGSLFTEEVAISPVRGRGGQIAHYVAVKRDVTRDLQIAEQLRQAQKMEAMGQMAAGVAHDFRNLLTKIQANAYFMQTHTEPGPAAAEHLRQIQDTVQLAGRLINQLLIFSRRQVGEPHLVALNQVIGELSPMIGHLMGARIETGTALAPDLWLVRSDRSQLEQVIMNLVINARDAMPGGGHLEVQTANVVLDEGYAAEHVGTRPGEYVLMSVRDTGTGMTDEVKAHLFEPFFTTKERGQGTGLGLATVFGIVKQLDGHIDVDSTVDQGTAFRLYMPRAFEPEEIVAA